MLSYIKQNITKKQLEVIFLIVLLILNLFLRAYQLNFSDFYGDETKVFYLRKDVGATDFIFNQRKGPTQFVVAWGMEKVSGGYNELYTRIPFCIAGILSVFVFYFLVRKIFGTKSAVFSSLLFTFNGFLIGFSKIVQYQSFVILFGLLSIYFFYLYFESFYNLQQKNAFAKKCILSFLSSVSIGLAFLSHWDAIFYSIVIFVLFISLLINKKISFKNLLQFVVFFIIPFFILVGLFYIPYFYFGYFGEYTVNYISRRAKGSDYIDNHSLITYLVYNPNLISLYVLFFSLFSLGTVKKPKSKSTKQLSIYLLDIQTIKVLVFVLWFVVGFLLFEYFIKSPGTHIINYIIPLLVLSGVGMAYVHNSVIQLNNKHYIKLLNLVYILTFALMFLTSTLVFVPKFNFGYPWVSNQSKIFPIKTFDKSKNHLFFYGFPYNGGWRQVRDYFASNNITPRSFYSNGNDTIGEYYLYGIPVHKPHTQQLPEYYIEIIPNQEQNYNSYPLLNLANQKVVFEYTSPKVNRITKIYRINSSVTTDQSTTFHQLSM